MPTRPATAMAHSWLSTPRCTRLLVIGEAVKALPAALLDQQPQVPWHEVARLRDLLAHHYYRVDVQIIRRTVDEPLRELHDAAVQLLADLDAHEA